MTVGKLAAFHQMPEGFAEGPIGIIARLRLNWIHDGGVGQFTGRGDGDAEGR